MPSRNEIRQQANLKLLDEVAQGGPDITVGDPAALPLPVAQLAALTPAAPGVEGVFTGGLTAVVLKLRVGERCYAVKLARRPCLVRNVDGQTSFLNELQRHGEIAALRRQGARFDGVVAPLYGSLRHSLVVSRWLADGIVTEWDERKLGQLYRSGLALMRHGFFEWDFSPGNVLDDGRQTWLFDFGYMLRFDPLREFNTAGRGDDFPQFHLAERIETRNLFAWLLAVETGQGRAAALSAFAMAKRVALDSGAEWLDWLQAQGAVPAILAETASRQALWSRALADEPAGALENLYLAEGWRSHSLDLADDLHGQSCTPSTLRRVDWLIEIAQAAQGALKGAGALSAEEAALSPDELVQVYRERRSLAEGWQVP